MLPDGKGNLALKAFMRWNMLFPGQEIVATRGIGQGIEGSFLENLLLTPLISQTEELRRGTCSRKLKSRGGIPHTCVFEGRSLIIFWCRTSANGDGNASLKFLKFRNT